MAEHEHHPHERWERFEEAAIAAEMETGHREETVEEAKRGVVRRFARLIGGFFLVALGTAMLVLPGPGLVTIAAGLFLLSRDIPFAARLLERVRERIPADADGNVSKPALFGGLAVTAMAVGASVWWTFLR